jgi:spore coat polysaccharide biosynthesis protein SpsF
MTICRRLVAVLACRNGGSRLYGKPLQPLDLESGWCILDQVVANLRRFDFIEQIVLAVSDGTDNRVFLDYASQKNLLSVVGDEVDVLGRLLKGLDVCGATDLFRVTTESPFLYWQLVEKAWNDHQRSSRDATFLDDVIDGCGFEIVTRSALQRSWDNGTHRHRSELCSLYIRENPSSFSISKLDFPDELRRPDLRLTVDYPEDLVLARVIYKQFRPDVKALEYELSDFVRYLDEHQDLVRLVAGFTAEGYSIMYL